MSETICAVTTNAPFSVVRQEIYIGPNRKLYVVQIDTWTAERRFFPLRVVEGEIVVGTEEEEP